MKTLKPKALYWASFNCFEFRIIGQAVIDCSRSGANDSAVEYWTPEVIKQAEKDGFPNYPTPDKIRAELKEYGAWDETELADDNQNWQRLVWVACHNIAEDEKPDCSRPVKSKVAA